MNTRLIKDYKPELTKDDVNLYHYINKLNKYIDNKEDPLKINQTYKIALHYNKKVEFNNIAELNELERKLSSYYCSL